jgi:GR25 family glycosyltransferase involved in LPS biosynthesis
MIRRLINIELSHLKLLNNAYQSGSSWALILEDDALVENAPAFAADLHHFLQSQSPEENPAFLNLSESFDYSTLGLNSHLHPHGTWGSHSEILSADRPMTNTVCAILYRDDFLKKLVPALSRIPISPVLPIDWKINAALLDLYSCGEIGADECWFISPGPILQGSMHGD